MSWVDGGGSEVDRGGIALGNWEMRERGRYARTVVS